GLNLSQPIPALQSANAPQMPAAVKQYYTGSWMLNGAFQFSTPGHGQWNSSAGTVSPRAGFAYKINDKTALRAGYGLYYTPWLTSTDITQANVYGFSLTNTAPAPLLGIPQMSLDNPFPSSYPLAQLPGKSLGPYTGLGDSLSWINPDRPRQYSSRLNVSMQREL